MKQPRKPIRRTSRKRAGELAKYRRIKRKFIATSIECAKCRKVVYQEPGELHHWAGRTGPLLCWEPGFRYVHAECHEWIETHRNEAVKLGLRAPDNLFNRPSLVIPR